MVYVHVPVMLLPWLRCMYAHHESSLIVVAATAAVVSVGVVC